MAERGPRSEASLAVIEVNDLRIRSVIADHDVQKPVAVDVDEHCRKRPVRRSHQVSRERKVAVTVVHQHSTHQGPVSAFRQDDVEIAAAREVTEADIG